jgi:hypothetical protein
MMLESNGLLKFDQYFDLDGLDARKYFNEETEDGAEDGNSRENREI